VAAVLRVLRPIWTGENAIPETASRLRGRIEAVLAWATVHGYRKGDNPAQWRGRLDAVLPSKGKLTAVKHFPALPYAEIGPFMADLRAQEGTSARALEYLILTAGRTNEVLGARFDEINEGDVWIIPPERMKGARQHRVPLSPAAKAVVEAMAKLRTGDFIFPSIRAGKPLSGMAMLLALARMERSDVTPHGFRSSFRDWCAEETDYPREVAEMALAHAVGSAVEGAYRRGDMMDKRRRLMEDWADYCAAAKKPGKVVPMRRASK
jgi:integrase